jgi:hypothetical protein
MKTTPSTGHPVTARIARVATGTLRRPHRQHAYRLSQVVFFGCESPKLFYR